MALRHPWVFCSLAVCLLVAAPGCDQRLPSCKLKSCQPCLDCQGLLGGYTGLYTNFTNSCIDAEISDQPFAIEFIDLITDSPDGYTYLVFDMVVEGHVEQLQMAVCAGDVPEKGQHAGHTLYPFCIDFEYEGFSDKPDRQVLSGYFVDPGDGSPLQIEGQVDNVKYAPPAQECVVSADITATRTSGP